MTTDDERSSVERREVEGSFEMPQPYAMEDWAEDLFKGYGNMGDWYGAAMALVAEVRRLRAIKDPGSEAVFWKNEAHTLSNELALIVGQVKHGERALTDHRKAREAHR